MLHIDNLELVQACPIIKSHNLMEFLQEDSFKKKY